VDSALERKNLCLIASILIFRHAIGDFFFGDFDFALIYANIQWCSFFFAPHDRLCAIVFFLA
jgi:hypothetical protein